MIGLEDIAGISSPEEGRAVGLALFNQLQRLQPQWTEITDDPSTWPPLYNLIRVKWEINGHIECQCIGKRTQFGSSWHDEKFAPDTRPTHWRPI